MQRIHAVRGILNAPAYAVAHAQQAGAHQARGDVLDPTGRSTESTAEYNKALIDFGLASAEALPFGKPIAAPFGSLGEGALGALGEGLSSGIQWAEGWDVLAEEAAEPEAAEGAGGIKIGPAERPGGIGQGAYRYQTRTPTPDMLNQSGEYTCGVTCIRQTVVDQGLVDPGDAAVAGKAGYLDPSFVGPSKAGTTAGPMADTLNDLVPQWRWQGGVLDVDALGSNRVVTILSSPETPSWMANLNGHWVMVDSFDGATVVVRDPWGLSGPGSGTGVTSTMTLDDFLAAWRGTRHTAVFAK